MNARVNLDLEAIKFVYRRYEDYFIPAITILASILLFVKIIVPQAFNLIDAQSKVQQESDKLKTLKSNLATMSSMNESDLNLKLALASGALPQQKDFAGAINAVGITASKANVTLGDFEFVVGDLSTKSAELAIEGYPSLNMVLSVGGGIDGLQRFMDELYKTAPLSEVINVSAGEGDSSVSTVFYYKPIPPITVEFAQPIKEISSADLKTVNEVSTWNNFMSSEDIDSTASAVSSSGAQFKTNPF